MTLTLPVPSSIRPTTDRVRKSLFDIIGEEIHQSIFLDLYAGSGIVGLEALSRGVQKAVFVERDSSACNALKANIKKANMQDKAQLIQGDAIEKLPIVLRSDVFNHIFMDPPYRSDLAMKTLSILSEMLPDDQTLIILEAFNKMVFPDALGRLRKIRTARYGDTHLIFWRWYAVPCRNHGD